MLSRHYLTSLALFMLLLTSCDHLVTPDVPSISIKESTTASKTRLSKELQVATVPAKKSNLKSKAIPSITRPKAVSGPAQDLKLPAQKSLEFEYVMGGFGGVILKVTDPAEDSLTIYYLDPGASVDHDTKTGVINLPMVFKAKLKDANAKYFRVWIGGALGRSDSPGNVPGSTRTIPGARPSQKEKKAKAKPKFKLIPKQVDVLATINVTDIKDGYLIEEGRAVINDSFVEDFRFVSSSLKDRFESVVMMKNKTKTEWLPNIRFVVLNKYGIKLGEAEVDWSWEKLLPSERKQEQTHFSKISHEGLFQYSKLGPVPDFDTPYCVVVQYPPIAS